MASPEKKSSEPVNLPELVVNLERLQEVTSLETDEITALTDLYFTQADECIPRLREKVSGANLPEAAKIAHKLAGSSLSRGLDRIGTLFRLIERASHEGEQALAENMAKAIEPEYQKVRMAIAEVIRRQST